jgi:hydrogenase maturation factor HypF (carbamoyltransferase family)
MFVDTELEVVLPIFDKLTTTTPALWGTMSSQRMVEHLVDVIRIATGESPQPLLIDEEKLPSMLRFLESDKPMAKEIQVPFATADMSLRNEELALAIDEYTEAWISFEELYETNPDLTHIHPYYGSLNYAQWKRLHAKHLTHHFNQFGLL